MNIKNAMGREVMYIIKRIMEFWLIYYVLFSDFSI